VLLWLLASYIYKSTKHSAFFYDLKEEVLEFFKGIFTLILVLASIGLLLILVTAIVKPFL